MKQETTGVWVEINLIVNSCFKKKIVVHAQKQNKNVNRGRKLLSWL